MFNRSQTRLRQTIPQRERGQKRDSSSLLIEESPDTNSDNTLSSLQQVYWIHLVVEQKSKSEPQMQICIQPCHHSHPLYWPPLSHTPRLSNDLLLLLGIYLISAVRACSFTDFSSVHWPGVPHNAHPGCGIYYERVIERVILCPRR